MADPGEPFASLSGFVYDEASGEALIGGNVSLREPGLGTTTSLNGYYTLPWVPAGAYTLVSTYIGYFDHIQTITLGVDEDVGIDLNLRTRPEVMSQIIINLDGNKREFEGSAALSLLSARATIQLPLAGRGSLSASFRRTYFDQTVARAVDDIPPYYFYDGNFKAFIDINATNKLTLSGFAGRDVLDFDLNRNSSDSAGLRHNWGNRTGSLRWTTVWSPRLFANFWITGSRFSSDFDLDEVIGFTESNEVRDLTLKGDFEYSHSPRLSARFGFEQKNLEVLYLQAFPDARSDISVKPTHNALYVTAIATPTGETQAEAGLRFNIFDADRRFVDLSPRFAVKHRLTPTINLEGSTGVYRQYLNRIPRAFITDIWTTANEFQERSTARHVILGYQS